MQIAYAVVPFLATRPKQNLSDAEYDRLILDHKKAVSGVMALDHIYENIAQLRASDWYREVCKKKKHKFFLSSE
jgi:hypothetical protein